ncbi:MAG: dihydrodipicolinate synthase family protein [Planctomycetota bacterium]|nr:dihydrodipicolinate synthase family protein [Planctomycetota bacterium]
MPISGLIPAVHSPLDENGELSLEIVEQQAKRCMETECGGVYVAGTTGECHSLSADERLALFQRWGEVIQGTNLSLICHVGDNSMPVARALAAASQAAGADAIASMAPSFFRPNSVDGLLPYLKDISSAAAETPFYFYDIPVMTHVEVSTIELLERSRTEFPNLAGLKFTNGNLMDLQTLLRVDPERYNILFGFDEMLSAAWLYGVRGAVGSTYNHFAKLYNVIVAAVEAGDNSRVQKLQNLSVEIIRAFQKPGFAAASKEAMAFFGVDCGTVRSPLQPLTNQQRSELRQTLESLGAMEWA